MEIKFGKYQLLERIAVGGMAEIYRARYTAAAGVTKQVVIKKILPHFAGNRQFLTMFVNEAKITAGLSHGNIVQVFDFGEIDGEYYLAMEHVHGQPLSRVLKRARRLGIPSLPTPFSALIAMEVLQGLHYAHSRLDEQGNPLQIIHRDISPPNVLLSYEGQVKIVDFGIAKARHATRLETQAGALKGKYAYLSPEQAQGQELDARSDLFATGIVLYEMLCGRPPFQGKMIQVLSQIVRGELAKPRAVNPAITPAMEKIILTAMAHQREQRYPTAETFREALAGYLYTHEPTFSTRALGHLTGYLFEPELLAEGQRVSLPAEFVEQAKSWRKLPSRPRSKARPGATEGGRPGAQAKRRLGLGRSRLPFVLAPLAAMILGALLVWGLDSLTTFSVELTSNPAGATVRVDRQEATAPTPLAIRGLSARKAHLIEVTAPGFKPWSQEVSPQPSQLVKLHAALEPSAP